MNDCSAPHASVAVMSNSPSQSGIINISQAGLDVMAIHFLPTLKLLSLTLTWNIHDTGIWKFIFPPRKSIFQVWDKNVRLMDEEECEKSLISRN